jgi:hypothetical protein
LFPVPSQCRCVLKFKWIPSRIREEELQARQVIPVRGTAVINKPQSALNPPADAEIVMLEFPAQQQPVHDRY